MLTPDILLPLQLQNFCGIEEGTKDSGFPASHRGIKSGIHSRLFHLRQFLIDS